MSRESKAQKVIVGVDTYKFVHVAVATFGVEGTGSYGASLAYAVRRARHRVVEVNRCNRRTRRMAGKSDTIDAEVTDFRTRQPVPQAA